MPTPHHIKRAARIHRRAAPEVLAAFERGDISAKRADLLLYMPADQQVTELTRRLSEVRKFEARNRLVAETIRIYLGTLGDLPPDLLELRSLIKAALV